MTETSFTTREVPWLQVGTVIDEAQSAADAMRLAGLDWDVELRRDGFQTAGGNWRVDQTRRKVVRTDTEEPLGTVSPTYEVLQYREAFDFMDQIDPRYVAAGSLKGGRQAWMVVQAPEHMQLETMAGEDPHDLYVVLRTSHDGTRAVEVNVLPLRGRCMNQMPLATFGFEAWDGRQSIPRQRWSIRHTKNLSSKLEQAEHVLGGLDAYARSYNETAARLVEVELELGESRKVLDDVLRKTYYRTQEARDKQVEKIMDVYERSPHNGFAGTAWGLMNAVTEYYDHFRNQENRAAETRWVQGLDGCTTKALNDTAKVLLSR
jgi:phage/plasmid-like protein (TIGR03299 family)